MDGEEQIGLEAGRTNKAKSFESFFCVGFCCNFLHPQTYIQCVFFPG